MNDSDITDNDDSIGKNIPQYDDSSALNYHKLLLHPPLKKNDSENENLKLQFIHETYPSVSKQSLDNSLFDPSFFKYTSKFIEHFLPPETSLKMKTILKYHTNDPDLKIVIKRIHENSRPVEKNL